MLASVVNASNRRRRGLTYSVRCMLHVTRSRRTRQQLTSHSRSRTKQVCVDPHTSGRHQPHAALWRATLSMCRIELHNVRKRRDRRTDARPIHDQTWQIANQPRRKRACKYGNVSNFLSENGNTWRSEISLIASDDASGAFTNLICWECKRLFL